LPERSRHMGIASRVGYAIAMVTSLLVTPARAQDVTAKDVTAKDLQVIGRTLGFMEDASARTVELGIVYVPGNPESARQAGAMQRLLGEGVAAGRITLRSRIIAIDQLGTAQNVGALFVVPAVGQISSAVMDAAKRLHIPAISTDVACVQAGTCVLAFHSEPTVEVFLSRAAAEGAGVRFTPAFRMLVKQM
jgi:hypothetical protein